MHTASRARRLCRILKPPIRLSSAGFISRGDHQVVECSQICMEACQNHSSFFSSATQSLGLAGPVHGNKLPSASCSIMSSLQYSSETSAQAEKPTETMKEMYDKILESVNTKRTMAPNAWTWSMIEHCKNREDIKLLFDALQNLRRFRLSNLRIHENFNCNLCREVTKACVRARALDFGKKALWKHNVYGLTPTIGSANHLLQYAKEHKDAILMQEVMKLLKKNNLPLQPSTADIVFSICYDTDNWELLTKYSKRFVKDGVKLHKAAFDIWMDFAAKVGNVESLWKIEKLRSESMKQHTVGSGFSCAKGLILEGKPEEAAMVIHILNQSLADAKRSSITVELQKLVSEWPFEIIKRKKEDDCEALAAALKANIQAMVSSLLNNGLEVKVNTEELTTKAPFVKV